MPAKIAVVGSVNMDIVAATQRLPEPGETVLTRRARFVPGGKGANQAVAAARLGAEVRMIGCVGDDAFGRRLINRLARDGVDVTGMVRVASETTGIAEICLLPGGENAILVVSGANMSLTPEVVNGGEITDWADAVLMQLEVPAETVESVALIANRKETLCILDAGGAQSPLEDSLYSLLDLVSPNEAETETLLGSPVKSRDDAIQASKRFLELGTGAAVIKLGKQGSVGAEGDETISVKAFKVRVRDTTAAGDAYMAALAVKMCEGESLEKAMRYASAASAVAVTRPGAQPSMPRKEEVAKFLKEMA